LSSAGDISPTFTFRLVTVLSGFCNAPQWVLTLIRSVLLMVFALRFVGVPPLVHSVTIGWVIFRYDSYTHYLPSSVTHTGLQDHITLDGFLDTPGFTTVGFPYGYICWLRTLLPLQLDFYSHVAR